MHTISAIVHEQAVAHQIAAAASASPVDSVVDVPGVRARGGIVGDQEPAIAVDMAAPDLNVVNAPQEDARVVIALADSIPLEDDVVVVAELNKVGATLGGRGLITAQRSLERQPGDPHVAAIDLELPMDDRDLARRGLYCQRRGRGA